MGRLLLDTILGHEIEYHGVVWLCESDEHGYRRVYIHDADELG